jgi:hypothetical protein
MAIDTDGTVDNGDVSSATFSNCTASFFGWPAGAATVTACNLSLADGGIDPSTDVMAINDTCNDISAACGTIRVQGDLPGDFFDDTKPEDDANVNASLIGAAGLWVTAETGACASLGNSATFSGDYDINTTTGNNAVATN